MEGWETCCFECHSHFSPPGFDSCSCCIRSRDGVTYLPLAVEAISRWSSTSTSTIGAIGRFLAQQSGQDSNNMTKHHLSCFVVQQCHHVGHQAPCHPTLTRWVSLKAFSHCHATCVHQYASSSTAETMHIDCVHFVQL